MKFLCFSFQIILQERESRRQKFLQDMMAGNFSSGFSRYLPPAWLASTGSGVADEVTSGEGVGLDESGVEKKAMVLSKIHSRRFRE